MFMKTGDLVFFSSGMFSGMGGTHEKKYDVFLPTYKKYECYNKYK